MIRGILLLTLFICFISLTLSTTNIAYNIPDPECTGVFNLCNDVDKERLGRLAIKAIHEQMDDDKDGMIEASETVDFIKEELESNADSVRHRRFQKADLQITIDDLWNQWKNSAVYNWTTEEVVDWLVKYVNMPMYVENFRRNQIDGRMIPRIAANQKHYLSSIMQIRDLRHKHRLIIKATDVVLFGPPQNTHSLMKDMILISALCISIGACLYAFVRHRKSQESMKRMLKDLETLQKAEGDLIAVTGKMRAMEVELQDKTKIDRGLLNTWFMEVQETKDEADKLRKRRDTTVDMEKQLRLALQEIEQLRSALRKAEDHARHQSFEPPSELVDLLKRTYQIEESGFEIKRKSAENSMVVAKEQMQKISKMQRGFFGAVRIAHTGCIDNISELIHTAKDRLSDIQMEYEEREKRWNRIGSLLDREDLINNSSLSANTNPHLPSTTSLISSISSSNNPSSDTHIRPKQLATDAYSLSSTNLDSPISGKKNGVIHHHDSSINDHLKTTASSEELLQQSNSSLDHSTTNPVTLRRRVLAENKLRNSGSSGEHFVQTSNTNESTLNNHSHELNPSTAVHSRQGAFDSLDIIHTSKSATPMFDIDNDAHSINEDTSSDDFQDKHPGNSCPPNDEHVLINSTDKSRKSLMTTKIFKSFSNMRSKKKHSTTTPS